jgi:hypothetical protein
MKAVTFAFSFVLTSCLVVVGVLLYPEVLGKAVTANNEFVFAMFLGPLCFTVFQLAGREISA